MKKTIASGAAALLLATAFGAVGTTAASAHTPEVTDTCDSISATLTNYEVRNGTPDVTEEKLVSAAVAYQPAVLGDAPLISAAVEYQAAVYGPTLFEFVHKNENHPNSPRWELEGWNADSNQNSKGWTSTGNSKPGDLISAEVAAKGAVYGERPVITAEVLAQDAVYETVIVTPGTPAEDNTITLILDDVTVAGPIHFGTSYQGTMPIDGTKDHTYTVVIDAIGTQYDKTIKGDTQACPVPLNEIPYPKLLANEVCGPDNDTVYPDPAWLEQYGHLVAGPWIDTKYKTIDGQRVVDGSAQIKAEFRKTHIWAGTSGTAASDFRRWMMYPGTAPFSHADAAVECPVVVEPPVEEPPVVVPPVVVEPVLVAPVAQSVLAAAVARQAPVELEDDTLAQTGGADYAPAALGGGLLALAGLALAATRILRRQEV